MKRGDRVRINNPESEFHEAFGVFTGMRQGWCMVRIDGYGTSLHFDIKELASPDVPMGKPLTTQAVAEMRTKLKLIEALEGDSLPTQWDTEALDVSLSLIGNCKEA